MRYYKKKEKTWTESTVQAAINEVTETNISIRKAAIKYNLSFSLLRQRLQEVNGKFKRKVQGRKTAIPAVVENYIATSIRKMGESGEFSDKRYPVSCKSCQNT